MEEFEEGDEDRATTVGVEREVVDVEGKEASNKDARSATGISAEGSTGIPA